MLHATAEWGGVNSVISCQYTMSHGISAGAAVLTMSSQSTPPAMTGPLIFRDGPLEIVIPDCKLDRCRGNPDGSWSITILDRRWRWRECGQISGWYNQLDPYNKVLPWTAKTPKQLAELCLKAMGETRYQIGLPEVAVLPPIQWDYANPANALSTLCDSLGCRVIYRLDTDTVLISPLGVGEFLPSEGSWQSDTPELDLPERPDRIVVVGQPTRYQAQFLLEAVGEDWDGSIRPINQLSYAPQVDAVQHRVTVTVEEAIETASYSITITDQDGLAKTYSYVVGAGEDEEDTAVILAAKINLPPSQYSAFQSTNTILIMGPATGEAFSVTVASDDPTGIISWVLTQQGRIGGKSWAHCPPPNFSAVLGDPPDVAATDRLTRQQALEFAKRSVFRYYRITARSSDGEKAPLEIPGFGVIQRREQIILQQTKVEQIEPQPQDNRIIDPEVGKPPINEFYDGHSRDRPAAVYGKTFLGDIFGTNSAADFRVREPFTIDTARQLVVFNTYVCRFSNGQCLPAEIVLETGCNVRDPITNALICQEYSYEFPEPRFRTPPAYFRKDDVQVNVIGRYHRTLHRLTDFKQDDADAIARSRHYLRALAGLYEWKQSQNRTYNGIVPIWLDGAIQQLTWAIGSSATTQVSRNSEHAPYIPSYPVRRKAEYLPPIQGGPNRNPPILGAEDLTAHKPGQGINVTL